MNLKEHWQLIKQTDTVSNNKKADWGKISVQKSVLTYESNRPIKFEVFDYRNSGDHVLVGGTNITFNELSEKANSVFPIVNIDKQPAGSLLFGSFA